jgi:hypothetical protein
VKEAKSEMIVYCQTWESVSTQTGKWEKSYSLHLTPHQANMYEADFCESKSDVIDMLFPEPGLRYECQAEKEVYQELLHSEEFGIHFYTSKLPTPCQEEHLENNANVLS